MEELIVYPVVLELARRRGNIDIQETGGASSQPPSPLPGIGALSGRRLTGRPEIPDARRVLGTWRPSPTSLRPVRNAMPAGAVDLRAPECVMHRP